MGSYMIFPTQFVDKEEMEGSQGRDDHGPQGNVGEKPRATSCFFKQEAAAAGLSTGHRHLKKRQA